MKKITLSSTRRKFHTCERHAFQLGDGGFVIRVCRFLTQNFGLDLALPGEVATGSRYDLDVYDGNDDGRIIYLAIEIIRVNGPSMCSNHAT